MNKRAGAAAAWVDTVETFGSGKLTVAEVLAPAIRLAEEGSVIFIPLLTAKFIDYSWL
jgi:gamma-glutamyltranspeptidase